jgi:hypothetical protein
VYPLLNDRAVELRKYAEHLKECPSGRSGCINRLLFEIEVAPSGVELAKKDDEILQGSAKTVYRPRGNDIDLCRARPLSEADRTPAVCRGLWRR